MPSLDYNNSVIIYKIKNLINGKIYIGQTKSTTKKRFSQHCEKRNKTVIGLAIKKYGRGSFRVSVLREGVETKTELDALEIAYIASCGSIAPSGYNVEEGGQASTMSKE
ncbi:GIY-YIG nuclease family protein, partial [Candidatus Pacearchaeota archaeon]|nr:GIY-YIG nuclease family protein [Candidatus Pacearchaeota archaeon]